MKTDKKIQELIDGYGSWVKKDCENVAGGTGRMTKDLYPYDKIFSPIKINRTTIKNRVVMAPMGNIDMCEETGRPNDKMLQYFFARAKGGVGLLTTGLIPVSHGIDHSVTEPHNLSYFPRIDGSRTNYQGWRDLAQGCHAYGSKIFIQLTPGLGRVGNPQCLMTMKKFPVSASYNPNYYISQIPCMRLSDHNMKKIISNAGQASADAQVCGMDGVYLHGHEGYLLEQCTNPAFNRRKMGRYANYQQFGLDLITEIRKRVGPNYPIMYRIDLSLALNETYGEEGMKEKPLHKFKKGRSVAQTLEYMENLVKCGVDIFDVDLGCYDNWWLPHPPEGMPAGCFLDVSEIVKKHFKEKKIISNAGVEVPVVGVGKLGYPDLGEKALRDEKCDMIMLGRPLLADSDWCLKAYSGKVEQIRPCIGCQEGCINEFVEGGHPQCAVNPRTGFEDVLPDTLPLASKIKKIGVVGSGPGGILTALTLAKRGHIVELLEKTEKVGGKINAGSIPKIKFDIANYLVYLNDQVKEAQKSSNFTLKKGVNVDTAYLKEQKYDAVVIAIGTKDINPPITGIEKVKTVQATTLLEHPEECAKAKKIVVVGGGVVGCEIAFYLKTELKKEVTVVEMLDYFMKGACTANRGYLLYYMKKENIKLMNCAKVVSFDKNKVIVEQNTSKNVPNPYNCWQPILPANIPNPLAKKLGKEVEKKALDADLVVMALGGKADESLFFASQAEHVADEVYNVGDSFKEGRVLEATRSAYNLSLRI
ncbi:MAG: FAD-dependent oxidoreductase [Sphaerochaetaceae bacterium]